MRAKALLSALCMSLSTGLAVPAQAQDAENFLFRACNEYKSAVFLAISNRASYGSSEWRTHGWYRLEPGCHDMGRYPRPWLYLYADAPDGSHWGSRSGVTICVPSAAFDRRSAGGYNCSPNERLRNFHEVRIEPNTDRYTMTFD